ncbi:hypothetical protein V12G01_16917 [Vibrio alginolyticus 12G01]|uniref:host specificity factor TipJ family phage tail protein n=1 Tax=Vibrio alginolyticus TaxID=663 RepID=UPI0000D54539|nr:host specificity factor TipJ family phage tail protein [Vibrio alginolyticus]EAS76948.1 hypothetical protein V12G01_16917 [Vibrio alginolyticus 12G01]
MTVLAVYPNKLNRSKCEFTPIKPGQTLNDWMAANIKGYYVSETPPFSYFVNKKQRTSSDWFDYVWQDGDLVELVAEPKDPASIAYAVIAVVAAGAAIYAMNQIPDNFQKTMPEGSPIYEANAQGNRVRLMGVIPELFGRHKTFPDIISEPHWYFSEDEEYLLMMTAIGNGEFELTGDDITISDTPVSKYAGDISYQVFAPGEDVTSHPAHENIYTSREVGSTSSTAGIELEGPINSITPSQVNVVDDTLGVVSDVDGLATEYWPVEWEAGHIIKISGSPGIREITEASGDGGWRNENGADILNFWSRDPDLHNCNQGDYVEYPTNYYVPHEADPVVEYSVGMVDIKQTFEVNGETFYALRILNGKGYWITVDTVPSETRHHPIKFHGTDDGRYIIREANNPKGRVDRLYPEGTKAQVWWDVFTHQGENKGWTLETEVALPGKPAGPHFACPASEVADKIYIDFKHPDGLGYVNKNGDTNALTVEAMIEWRGEGETEWNQVKYERRDGTRDQLAETIEIDLGRKVRPEVRVYRITNDNKDLKYLDRIEYRRLKARLDSNTKYDDFTTIAFKIRGSNSLSRSAENKLGVVPIRKLQIPDGLGGWTQELYPTRDIAPAIRYIILDSGLSDVHIGHYELLRLHEVWKARGDTFDAVFTDSSTLFEVLKKVLLVGYSEPTLKYGQIIPVRDEPRTTFDFQYQPDNMLGKGLERSGSFIREEEPDGVEVEYFSTLTWKPETIMCLLPGDLGIKPEKVRAFGVTDPTKAWQFGMRVRRKKRYRRFQYSFQTEMDAFNSNYLDYVALGDDVPGYAQSGRLEGFSIQNGKTHLWLDLPLEWESGVHHITVRKPDGRASGPHVCTKGSHPNEVIITSNLGFTPSLDGEMEPPLWLFGPADKWCYPALINDVTPQGTEKCSVKAVNYDVRVYDDDDNEPDEQGYPKVA